MEGQRFPGGTDIRAVISNKSRVSQAKIRGWNNARGILGGNNTTNKG